jgi:hypothetical protein
VDLLGRIVGGRGRAGLSPGRRQGQSERH